MRVAACDAAARESAPAAAFAGQNMPTLTGQMRFNGQKSLAYWSNAFQWSKVPSLGDRCTGAARARAAPRSLAPSRGVAARDRSRDRSSHVTRQVNRGLWPRQEASPTPYNRLPRVCVCVRACVRAFVRRHACVRMKRVADAPTMGALLAYVCVCVCVRACACVC